MIKLSEFGFQSSQAGRRISDNGENVAMGKYCDHRTSERGLQKCARVAR